MSLATQALARHLGPASPCLRALGRTVNMQYGIQYTECDMIPLMMEEGCAFANSIWLQLLRDLTTALANAGR